MRILVLAATLLALSFHSATHPLASAQRAQLEGRFWHSGCPVPLSDLRLLTVYYRDFDGNVQQDEHAVNRRAATPLARVFRQLHRLRFPISHMRIIATYVPKRRRPDQRD